MRFWKHDIRYVTTEASFSHARRPNELNLKLDCNLQTQVDHKALSLPVWLICFYFSLALGRWLPLPPSPPRSSWRDETGKNVTGEENFRSTSPISRKTESKVFPSKVLFLFLFNHPQKVFSASTRSIFLLSRLLTSTTEPEMKDAETSHQQ